MRVLSTAGDPMVQPFVSITEQGGDIAINIWRNSQTPDSFRVSRDEALVVMFAILNCLDFTTK